MNNKHLISLYDWTPEEIKDTLILAGNLKSKQKRSMDHQILKGKTLGMIFSKSSTRTRVSFEVGMYQLGGSSLFLNSNDIQLGRGESIYDTANVLSRYLDGIMIRTFNHNDVLDLAKHGQIPIINGLTDDEHPCQALADLQTIMEQKGNFTGLKLAYVGDGNNVANSLLHACTKVGMDISIGTPEGYQCPDKYIAQAKEIAASSGSRVFITNDPVEAVKNADVVYTDTWVSMGQETEKESRIATFMPYQVNTELFSHAKSDAIFLHCLPAYRGYEVTDDVIDGPNSFVFDEAENRMHAQKAVLVKLLKD